MMHPGLLMVLATERVADLLRDAGRGRLEAGERAEASRPAGPPYRTPSGAWIYGRRDSS
jgi:hypothetical protein